MPDDLSGALARVARGRAGPHGLGGSVYEDLVSLEATRRLIDREATWHIPAMNRRLVEAGTHEAGLEELAAQLSLNDPLWQKVWADRQGKQRARATAAGTGAVDWSKPFLDFRLYEEAVELGSACRTR